MPWPRKFARISSSLSQRWSIWETVPMCFLRRVDLRNWVELLHRVWHGYKGYLTLLCGLVNLGMRGSIDVSSCTPTSFLCFVNTFILSIPSFVRITGTVRPLSPTISSLVIELHSVCSQSDSPSMIADLPLWWFLNSLTLSFETSPDRLWLNNKIEIKVTLA